MRGEGGYEDGSEESHGLSVPRLRVLDLQVTIEAQEQLEEYVKWSTGVYGHRAH